MLDKYLEDKKHVRITVNRILRPKKWISEARAVLYSNQFYMKNISSKYCMIMP